MSTDMGQGAVGARTAICKEMAAIARRVVLLLPGQGSQRVGMAETLRAAYPAARAVLEEAEAAAGLPLARLMRDGPEVRAQRPAPRPLLCTHTLTRRTGGAGRDGSVPAGDPGPLRRRVSRTAGTGALAWGGQGHVAGRAWLTAGLSQCWGRAWCVPW
jgi:hypothetical protein